MFGNPYLKNTGPDGVAGTTDDKWVAVQFRQTLLRVSPFQS